MYPIELLPVWQTVVGVVVFGVMTYWVAMLDKSARVFGLASLAIVLISGWCWFSSLPEWTAWLTLTAVIGLFLIGMNRSEDKDDKWHFGALAVALFSKLAMWTVPFIWDVLTGKVDVKFQLQGWMILVLLVGVAIGVTLGFSERFRSRVQRWIRRGRIPEPSTQPATT